MRTFLLVMVVAFIIGCGNKNTQLDLHGKQGDWVNIYNGKDLKDWRVSENPSSFAVVDGILTANGPKAHAFYIGPELGEGFDNFELEAEIRTTPGANSGIYFHTKYQAENWPDTGFEVQVNLSHIGGGDYLELKKSASLYGVRNVYFALANDGDWYKTRIVVNGDRVQIWLNDIKTVDYFQLYEPNRLKSLGKGTFAIQCHDPASKVEYKSIKVRKLELEPSAIRLKPLGAWHERMMHLQQADHFAFIDLNPEWDEVSEIEDKLLSGYVTGIGVGLVCKDGVSAEIQKLFDTYPTVMGKIHSDTISDSKVSYVVGNISDVDIIKNIKSKKINILSLDGNKNEKILASLLGEMAANNVALEIDNVNKIPSIDLIIQAKSKGCKFSFSKISSLEEVEESQYFMDVVENAKLNYKDIYIPARNKI